MHQYILYNLTLLVSLLLLIFYHSYFKLRFRQWSIKQRFGERVSVKFNYLFGHQKEYQISFNKHQDSCYHYKRVFHENPKTECLLFNSQSSLNFMFVAPSLIKQVLNNPQFYRKKFFGLATYQIFRGGLLFSEGKEHKL